MGCRVIWQMEGDKYSEASDVSIPLLSIARIDTRQLAQEGEADDEKWVTAIWTKYNAR